MSNELHVLNNCSFGCNRTCPQFERVDVCRFNAFFALIGARSIVNSETVAVDVVFQSVDALTDAVEQCNGQPLGFGLHELFQNDTETGKRQRVEGFGFSLPDWRFPLIAGFDGKLYFDDYEGKWGDVADLERLRNCYAISAAKRAADALGWAHESNAEGLRVFHPSGGTLQVTGAGVDALGFNGNGCHTAADELAQALGATVDVDRKQEFYNVENPTYLQE